jgi:DNA repair exonuclease SbcCD ATPase subunit
MEDTPTPGDSDISAGAGDDRLVDRIEKSGDMDGLLSNGETVVKDIATADLVEEVISRLETDSIPDSSRRNLAESLDASSEETRALETRVAHLQQRLSDVEAYTAPLADLHDEYGSPEEVIADHEQRLVTLESARESDADRLDNLASDVERLADWREQLAGIIGRTQSNSER